MRIGLTAIVWAGGAAALAAAEPSGFRSPAAGDRLPANEPLEVAWSLDPDAFDDRDEMELVLSLDGGDTFPIRVTGRLPTDVRHVAWRVPALATERAVLALRAGDEDRDESETILAVSEPFAISASPESAPELLYAVAHEWRTRDALDGAPIRTTPRDLAPSRDPELSAVDRDADSTETPPTRVDVGRNDSAGTIEKATPRHRPAVLRHLSNSLPLPLRL
jgi:hypothetical protein